MNMRISILFMMIIPGICLFCPDIWATEAYVTDSFRISLRRGPGVENKILKFLPSGQPVKILESKEGWSQIQLPEGDEGVLTGWVLDRYLITRIPWEEQAKQFKTENIQLSEELISLKKELEEKSLSLKELSEEFNENSVALAESLEMYNKLKKEAADYLRLKAEDKKNREDLLLLMEENNTLKSSQTLKFLAMGALILLCGLMIGLLVGKRERKRLSYY